MIAWVLARIRSWFGTKSSEKQQAIESVRAMRSFVLVMKKYTNELPQEQEVIKAKMRIAIFLTDAHVETLEKYFNSNGC